MKRLLLLSFLVLGLLPGTASSALAACYKPNCWGAIAINPASLHYGWSVNNPNRGYARRRAIDKCGRACSKVLSFRNGCGAFATPATGSGGYGWGTHFRASTARRIAMGYCRRYNPGQGCRIRVTACTAR